MTANSSSVLAKSAATDPPETPKESTRTKKRIDLVSVQNVQTTRSLAEAYAAKLGREHPDASVLLSLGKQHDETRGMFLPASSLRLPDPPARRKSKKQEVEMYDVLAELRAMFEVALDEPKVQTTFRGLLLFDPSTDIRIWSSLENVDAIHESVEALNTLPDFRLAIAANSGNRLQLIRLFEEMRIKRLPNGIVFIDLASIGKEEREKKADELRLDALSKILLEDK